MINTSRQKVLLQLCDLERVEFYCTLNYCIWHRGSPGRFRCPDNSVVWHVVADAGWILYIKVWIMEKRKFDVLTPTNTPRKHKTFRYAGSSPRKSATKTRKRRVSDQKVLYILIWLWKYRLSTWVCIGFSPFQHISVHIRCLPTASITTELCCLTEVSHHIQISGHSH